MIKSQDISKAQIGKIMHPLIQRICLSVPPQTVVHLCHSFKRTVHAKEIISGGTPDIIIVNSGPDYQPYSLFVNL